ncbi:MAG: hypothetical protein ACXACU_08015 [Candidatus Hodarchaeales archaeon]|jgi:hypothetical protein
MQNKKDLERFYAKKDPWGFMSNPHDAKRKQIIIEKCEHFCKEVMKKDRFTNALELGAGEGWITKDLPSLNVYGYELSDTARSRWPSNVKNFDPNIKYDLIIAPGVLYRQYDHRKFLRMIREHSCGVVMTISIKAWEINDLKNQIYDLEFPYRQYVEKLRVHDATRGGL